MSLEIQDQEAAAVAVAPRVTLDDIKANIASEHYINAGNAVGEGPFASSLGLLTLCVLVTKSGFTIVGKSACASPENYNEALGRKIAYEDAVGQLWGFMGYALREKLAA